MRRRRREAAFLAVLLTLGGVLAAHHAGAPAAHPGGHGAMTTGDTGHEAPLPASDVEIAFAICVAVLPLIALVAVAAARLLTTRWRFLHAITVAAQRVDIDFSPARRSRAGPRLLCVMRC